MRQNSILENVTSVQLRSDIPEFRAGDTVKVFARSLKVHVNVFSCLKVLLLSARALASKQLLQFVRFLQVLVWNVHSHYTHHVLKRLKLLAWVKYAVQSCTTCVLCKVRQLVLKNVAATFKMLFLLIIP